ncbi:MAG: hypothetical protein C4516_02285 [Oxalobacter sp.]|nr:MAG: hypothetical protein C4516_02285 [Oxalobacter sp.]
MKIAFACWDNRIAPVFDTARHIHVVEVSNEKVLSESNESLQEPLPQQKVRRLLDLGVNALVCGAISRPLHRMLVTNGIQVMPFLAGDLRELVQAWCNGKIQNEQYVMPGCCGRGWGFGNGLSGGRGLGGGRGRGRSIANGLGTDASSGQEMGRRVNARGGRGNGGGRNRGNF